MYCAFADFSNSSVPFSYDCVKSPFRFNYLHEIQYAKDILQSTGVSKKLLNDCVLSK